MSIFYLLLPNTVLHVGSLLFHDVNLILIKLFVFVPITLNIYLFIYLFGKRTVGPCALVCVCGSEHKFVEMFPLPIICFHPGWQLGPWLAEPSPQTSVPHLVVKKPMLTCSRKINGKPVVHFYFTGELTCDFLCFGFCFVLFSLYHLFYTFVFYTGKFCALTKQSVTSLRINTESMGKVHVKNLYLYKKEGN